MSTDGHVWTSAFERLGDENRMVTKCLQHPDARPYVTYDWPTADQLAEHEKTHEEEVNATGDRSEPEQRDQPDHESSDAQP